MLKDVRFLKLQGANFAVPTELPLFCDGNSPAKAVLLYGRNGSGKSTIAHAFGKIKGLPADNVHSALLLDDQGHTITLTDEEKNHVCIFDEDYINQNVRIQEDGLGSIVLLGEQAGLAELIASATEELSAAENEKKQKKAVLDEYNDHANEKSPEYYMVKMYSALQQDNGWAGRKRRIEQLRRNASVSDSTYKEFVHLSPEKTRDELLVDFYATWERLENAQSGASSIPESVPTIAALYKSYGVDAANELLAQTIEHPELTEREQYLLRLVQAGRGEDLKNTVQEINSPEITICPKCFQPLPDQYKIDLIASIQKVLSDEVKKHQNRLRDLLVQDVELDLNAFRDLPSYQSCMELIGVVNQVLHQNNALIQAKIDNPYTPVTDESATPVAEIITTLEEGLKRLEEERIIHNRAVTNTLPIKAALTSINNEIAYWDIIELSEQYTIRQAEKGNAESAYIAAQTACQEKQNRLNALNARRDSIDIAIDVINAGLKYIFFSENRIQICMDGRSYKLFCNGHPVRPKDVSVGERNIIGLCYFFTNILERKSVETAYSEEYLLIVDDPISSFDLENRVGILSYLKYQLSLFLLGNIDTRALVMTHDLLTAVDIGKMCTALMADCNRKFNGRGSLLYLPEELSSNQIVRFINKRNEYTSLVSLVYEYARGGATNQEPYIGNVIRQVLEAFSTFEFKKGIEDVATDDEILAEMEYEEHRKYFKNLMYRLVLNEGSHRYDQTRNMQVDFFTMISEPDKRRTAKEILCFIKLLNPPHIKAHLNADAINEIDSWCEEIRNRAITPT